MKTDTASDLVTFVEKRGQASAHQLSEHFGISPQAIHKHLRKLLEEGVLRKVGQPPKVLYIPGSGDAPDVQQPALPPAAAEIIEKNYLVITPGGEIYEGVEGFINDMHRQGRDPKEEAKNYLKAWRRAEIYREQNGLIDGIPKLKQAFHKDMQLDQLYYCDFFSFDGLGRTKLGALLLYGKQGQNRDLIKRVYAEIVDRLQALIKAKNIDAVGFIPPTVQRSIQFQKELERLLHLDLPHIGFIKAGGGVSVPQKVLPNVKDRVENARSTIFVQPDRVYESILLIDDAVGSGATLNETARKLKERGYCNGPVIGLAVTGSFTGFDILSEV